MRVCMPEGAAILNELDRSLHTQRLLIEHLLVYRYLAVSSRLLKGARQKRRRLISYSIEWLGSVLRRIRLQHGSAIEAHNKLLAGQRGKRLIERRRNERCSPICIFPLLLALYIALDVALAVGQQRAWEGGFNLVDAYAEQEERYDNNGHQRADHHYCYLEGYGTFEPGSRGPSALI